MHLEEINRVLLGAYHDPDLAVFMRDALEDLGISWPQWLEQSGTLERLADAWWAGHLPIFTETTEVFDAWRVAIRTGPRYDFERLCRAFRVPPVKLEVSVNHWMSNAQYYRYWGTDLPVVTLVVLKEAVRIHAQTVEQLRCGDVHVCEDFGAILRDALPEARGYQIRVGDGPVDERVV